MTQHPLKCSVYLGEFVCELRNDGRTIIVVEPFGFRDAAGLEWPVPSGCIVAGTSIPRALWSIVGEPFEGRHRDASGVHGFHCDVRKRLWLAVHRMFYEGMLVSGCSPAQAALLYAAVYWGGTRWSTTVIHNATLADRSRIALAKDECAKRAGDVLRVPVNKVIAQSIVTESGSDAIAVIASGARPVAEAQFKDTSKMLSSLASKSSGPLRLDLIEKIVDQAVATSSNDRLVIPPD